MARPSGTRREGRDLGLDGGTKRQGGVDLGGQGLGGAGTELLEGGEAARGLGSGVGEPGLEVGLGHGLGGEGRVVGRGREGAVHLGRALADQAGDGEEQLLALARGGALGLRDEPRLLELAVEVVERPAPAVALVGDEAEEGGVGRGLAVRADALDRAQERRGVPEVRHVGQEAADLDLGVDAGLEPAVGLHDHPVADQDRAVALLGTEAAHRRVLGQLQLAAPLPRLAADTRPRRQRWSAPRARRPAVPSRSRPSGWRRRGRPGSARGAPGPTCRAAGGTPTPGSPRPTRRRAAGSSAARSLGRRPRRARSGDRRPPGHAARPPPRA